jgi:hypothetical protein
MATNAELTEENETLRARVQELEDANAALAEQAAAAPAAPAANAGPHRMSFELSEGTRQDLLAAARDTNEDGKRRVITDPGSNVGFVVTRNPEGEVQVQSLEQEPEAFMDDPDTEYSR